MTTQGRRITCPICGSDDVHVQECGGFGWLECAHCRHRWNEEDERREQAQKHKRKECTDDA